MLVEYCRSLTLFVSILLTSLACILLHSYLFRLDQGCSHNFFIAQLSESGILQSFSEIALVRILLLMKKKWWLHQYWISECSSFNYTVYWCTILLILQVLIDTSWRSQSRYVSRRSVEVTNWCQDLVENIVIVLECGELWTNRFLAWVIDFFDGSLKLQLRITDHPSYAYCVHMHVCLLAD